MTTDSIAGRLERLGILDTREEPDPAWYRVLRFVCIWLYLMLFCAGAALLLTHMARPASASVSAPAAAAVECEDDGLHSVRGGGECLAIRTLDGGRGADGASTLLVLIHGDNSGGGPSGFPMQHLRRFATPGVTVVSLIRPGYYDSEGRRSSGTSYRFTGDGYRPQVVDAVGDAIARLRRLHQARKVVVAGVSGGSAIAGVLLGRRPGLIDAAVLAGCPCDVQRWRDLRGSGHWRRSLSPHAFAGQVPADTFVLAVTGEEDTNTRPELARDYIDALRSHGVDAHFVLAPGTPHPRLRRSEALDAAIEQALAHVRPTGVKTQK